MTTADQFMAELGMTNIAPSEANATGLLAPIMRSVGHLLYALAASSATPPLLTPEELADEVQSAAAHLDATFTARADILSSNATARTVALRLHTQSATDNWHEWTEEERPRCLLALINYYMSLATFLDRELAGIGAFESNPGSSL